MLTFACSQPSLTARARLAFRDVLYLPPYVWHHVETLTPSVSMATLSHADDIRDGMNAVYRLDHKCVCEDSESADHTCVCEDSESAYHTCVQTVR